MPIFDAYGDRVVAFSSRDPDAPKRWQHWHEQFDKSNYLFGLHIAKPYIRRAKKAIVVEGQFDVTYAHTAGFKMTVGLCGSAFSIVHIALLARYCNEIYLVMDPDVSGDNAVERAAKLYVQYNLDKYNLSFIPLNLPDKLDPDDFIYKCGSQAMVTSMRVAKDNAQETMAQIYQNSMKRDKERSKRNG